MVRCPVERTHEDTTGRWGATSSSTQVSSTWGPSRALGAVLNLILLAMPHVSTELRVCAYALGNRMDVIYVRE